MTTTTMMVPSMIVVTLGSTDRKVRSLRTRRRMKTATIGPTMPPLPPAEAHAAEHDRGDAGQEVGARDRRADAGAHGQRRGRPSPRTARPARRRRSGSGRRRRRSGRRPGCCCRWRRSRGRGGSGAAGSRRRRGTMTRRTSAFGIHCGDRRRHAGDRRPCRRSAPSAIRPPRRPGASSTRSAAPSQTKSIASVTTMSGTRVTHDQRAVDGAEHEAEEQHERDGEDGELLARALHQDRGGDAGERHHRGDREVDAAGDDHDRLGRRREGEGQGGAGQRSDARRRRSRAGSAW